MNIRLVLILIIAVFFFQCETDSPQKSAPETEDGNRPIKIICMGGGITTGVGHATNLAYPALIQQNFASRNRQVKVVNAGIKGETSEQQSQRIDWILQQRFDVFILAPTWEDFLKGHKFETVVPYVRQLLEKVKRTNPEALIVLLSPPLIKETEEWSNELQKIIEDEIGGHYFENPLSDLSESNDWQLNKNYPTPAGQRKIADELTKMLVPLLEN